MSDPVQELQQLKGIGAITAQRLVAAGLVTFTAIVESGEEGLRAISGINPRNIPAILEQAGALAGPTEEPVTPVGPDDLKVFVEDLRTVIRKIATAARERFPEELTGKIGHKLTRNMVAGLDALYAIEELLERRPKRVRKALVKARKRLSGLPEGELTEIRKGLKRVRKTLEQVIS
jgi:hypothetical protein